MIENIGNGFYLAQVPTDRLQRTPQHGQWMCVPASAQMVLSSHGIETTQERLAAWVHGEQINRPTSFPQGLSLVAGLHWNGGNIRLLTATPLLPPSSYSFTGLGCVNRWLSSDAFVQNLAADKPLLAFLNPPPGEKFGHHAVVVTGVTYTFAYDGTLLLNSVIFADPNPDLQNLQHWHARPFAERLAGMLEVQPVF